MIVKAFWIIILPNFSLISLTKMSYKMFKVLKTAIWLIEYLTLVSHICNEWCNDFI